jgi:hypothetical protein
MTETFPHLPPPAAPANQDGAAHDAPETNSQITEIPATSQESPLSMLDVHASHSAVRGWRDFFVHIAIVVVGLCIAVGLQQTVEFVQHHYQLADTRKALRSERAENYQVLARNTQSWRYGIAELQNNLQVFRFLLQHPGTPQEKLPGIIVWGNINENFKTGVWEAAHQSGAIALMSREEIEANAALYYALQAFVDSDLEAWRAINEAARYTLYDSDPSHLSAAQVAEEIELILKALSIQFTRGTLMENVVRNFPDFPVTVTQEELRQLRHPPDKQTKELLGPADALTKGRLRGAGYVDSSPPAAHK